MLRRTVVFGATVLLCGVHLAGGAYADDGPVPGGKGSGKVCEVEKFCVGAEVGATAPDSKPAQQPASKGTGKKTLECEYTKLEPKPPASAPEWQGNDPANGDIYLRACTDGGDNNPDGLIFVPEGAPPAPPVDPGVLAQRATDSMKLTGPAIASPRTAGTYVVGVPMWMWVNPGPTTYGPNTASASAGGVTVTATAQVDKIEWAMGDGTSVTCASAGTPYDASLGKKLSPDCGHVYRKSSTNRDGGRYHVVATATWTVNWQVAGGAGQGGQLSETRVSETDVAIGQLKVLN